MIDRGISGAMVKREFLPDGLVFKIAFPMNEAGTGKQKTATGTQGRP
jgi:hypothetical protein